MLRWEERKLRTFSYWHIHGIFPFNLNVSIKADDSHFGLLFGISTPVRGQYIEMTKLWEGQCHDLDEGKAILLEKLLNKLKAEPGCG